MKAIVLTKYGTPDDLELQDVAKPTPKEDEVLVKVHTTAINDWDWGLARGEPFYMRLFAGLPKPRSLIMGAEAAGDVEAVGKDVTQFQPGDGVYGDLSETGFGGFAEYVCVPEKALASKPAAMSYVDAAAIPHAVCLAVQGLIDVGQLQAGERLLINGGGGGVGTLGVQIAKHMGVEGVTGVDSADKFDMMRSVGFEHLIDYKQEDFTKNGQQYDLILDTKTTRFPFDYTRVLAPNGRYVTVGSTTPRIFQMLFFGPIIRRLQQKQISIVGLKTNKGLDYANELFEAGHLKPIIDGPYPLADVPQCLQYFGEGKHKGKVVIAV
ncbi:MAG: NAD(P)-dependent alcohol dehydrogenase [Chloroflexota bacterium]